MFDGHYESDYEDVRANHRQGIRKCVMILCVLAIVVGIIIPTYNNLVEKEENIKFAKSNVENMMQRRLELIPDLVETVKAVTLHEEKVFTEISKARKELISSLEGGEVSKISKANSELSQTINNLLAVAEDYPDLTSGQHYISLMDQLERSVNRIAIAREDYNVAVSQYNKEIRRFPNSIFARLLGFKKYDTFEADEAARQNNMVNFGT